MGSILYNWFIVRLLQKGLIMKSLVLFSYKQPVEGSQFRWGVLNSSRDTKKVPLSYRTIYGYYRKYDDAFLRSQTLDTVKTRDGVKAFYRERQSWKVTIPFIGSIIEKFI
jgi:hypothetical protein